MRQRSALAPLLDHVPVDLPRKRTVDKEATLTESLNRH